MKEDIRHWDEKVAKLIVILHPNTRGRKVRKIQQCWNEACIKSFKRDLNREPESDYYKAKLEQLQL